MIRTHRLGYANAWIWMIENVDALEIAYCRRYITIDERCASLLFRVFAFRISLSWVFSTRKATKHEPIRVVVSRNIKIFLHVSNQQSQEEEQHTVIVVRTRRDR